MIVVDTSALIAILLEEPETASFVRAIVASGDSRLSAPNAFEYLMVAKGIRAVRSDDQIRRIFELPRLSVVPWTESHAELALAAFLRFGKGHHPAKLNFGDCMSYALAKSLDAPLLFKGSDFTQTDIVSAV